MRDLKIAYGNNRQAKTWVNKAITLPELMERLRVPVRTTESVEEYAQMNKGERDSIKDKGGFVAGALRGGRRKTDTVECRSMLSLDGDHIPPEFLTGFEEICPYAALLYTTHSHTPENPRARIVIPLTRDVTPEEFVAVARYTAQALGIEYFDECSYRPNQMMYWPSTPLNGEYVFKTVEKAWLDPDAVLQVHPEWHDPTQLPTSSRESRATTVTYKKVQDPLTKEGLVGAFNRVYFPITTAIDTFLSDVYEPTEKENRYHFKASGSMAGVEIIDGGKFAYSHHAKDPAYLTLCNAFDLVRIHIFGNDDEKQSFRDMCEFAGQDEQVKILLLKERQEQAAAEFTPCPDGVDTEWQKKLKYMPRSGQLENSLHNLTLILQNDEYLKNIVFNQLADGMEIKGEVPWKHPARFWRDADDAQLVCYIDSHYGTFSAGNYQTAVAKVTDDRSYHPIKEYFDALPEWDGIDRVDTLLIDYLGAEDNAYVRAITRKTLCAAYMRVYLPGIKFDCMPVLCGGQGIGKSTFIAKLGRDWFSDSLNLSDMNDKTAAEKLQGYWIIEIGELAGMKKADLDKVKAFISRQDDKYRASFGRRVTPHPRQCVFFGTTNNENGYLRDITGNRRYWNVRVTGNGPHKPWEMTEDVVAQIWAETAVLAKAGETLYLPPELEDYARMEQRSAMERDDREGMVEDYLDMPLPEAWDNFDIGARREYLYYKDDKTREKAVNKRTEVCNIEIWCECFGKQKEDMKPADSYAISAIMMRLPDWDRTDIRKRLRHYGLQRIYKRKPGGKPK